MASVLQPKTHCHLIQGVGSLSTGPYPAQGPLSLINILRVLNPVQKRFTRELGRRAAGALRDLVEALLEVSWNINSYHKSRSVPPLKGLYLKITAYPALKRWAILFRPA